MERYFMDWKNRSAYVFVKTQKGRSQDVWKKFQSWDNVIGTWIVAGKWDVIVWFDATDWDTVHSCVATIKDWNEVEQTSSHMVYDGFKNDSWWWDKPAGAWVMVRGNKIDEPDQKIKKWNWTTSGASIPGEWDYMAWIEGQDWDEVWNHLLEIKTENWQTASYIPIKSWWNQKWKDSWW
jgi:hypothetical protein